MGEAIDPLNLINRTKDLNEFVMLNDDVICASILFSNDPRLDDAKKLLRRFYVDRDLPKLMWEVMLPQSELKTMMKLSYGIPRNDHEADVYMGQTIRDIVRDRFMSLLGDYELRENEYYITNHRPIGALGLSDFDKNHVYFYDDKQDASFTIGETMYNSVHLKHNMENDQDYIIVRVYVDGKHKDAVGKLVNGKSKY